MDNLEQSLITLFSLQSIQNNSQNPLIMVGGMFGIFIIKSLINQLPKVSSFLFDKCKKKFEDNIQLPTMSTNITAEIKFERDYSSKLEGYELADALIEHFCNLDEVKTLSRRHFFLFNSKKEFKITDNIYGKLININFDGTTEKTISSVVFNVYSYNLKLSQIKSWCEDVLEKYKEQKQTKLLKHKYFFSEISNMKNITFKKTIFKTTKSLNNLFGEHITEASKRLNIFVNEKKWYEEKGIPYTLGFLLYGSPGCGKTLFYKSNCK
jgi:hypothetical protein